MRKTRAPFFIIVLSIFTCGTQAQELWVDRNSIGGTCSDDRPREEVSKSTPWCSLGLAGSETQPGDTVWVRKGNYTEAQTSPGSNGNAVLQPIVSGRADAPITIRAAEGEKVTLSPQGNAQYGISLVPANGKELEHIKVSGLEIQGASNACVEVFKTSDVVLSNLDIHSCKNSSVEIEQSDRVTLESSHVHDNSLTGNTSAVDLYQCGKDNIIRGNKISGNAALQYKEEGHGIIMDTCRNEGSAIIEGNEISGNQGWCVVILASDNATIRKNICKENGTLGKDSYGQYIGEINTAGSNIDIDDNVAVARDGAVALNIRANTDNWNSNWASIAIKNNIFWSPNHKDIIEMGDSDAVTVSEYQSTYAPWGAGDRQVDPKLANQESGNDNQDSSDSQNDQDQSDDQTDQSDDQVDK